MRQNLNTWCIQVIWLINMIYLFDYKIIVSSNILIQCFHVFTVFFSTKASVCVWTPPKKMILNVYVRYITVYHFDVKTEELVLLSKIMHFQSIFACKDTLHVYLSKSCFVP